MISKDETLEYLLELKEKDENIGKYINILKNMSQDEWIEFTNKHSIENLGDVKKQIKIMENVSRQKFANLNHLISFGTNNHTMHIHLVPTDAHFLLNRQELNSAEFSLIDALEKIQDMMENNEEYKDINQVYAVSGLIKRPIDKIFVKLGFDVKTMKIEDAKNDEELSKFYERFKDKNKLGRAVISKEKLLSKEWNNKKSEIKAEHINDIIDKNIKNKYENINNPHKRTDCNLLYEISNKMATGIKINDRKNNEITTPFSKENTLNTALEFFKSIDNELYTKAKNIVDGKSNIKFRMYDKNEIKDFSKKDKDGFLEYSKTSCVDTVDGKSIVYVPLNGTVEDIYLLVHEISHTFDLSEEETPTRNIMGEVTPACFEAMLGNFLLENNVLSKNDILSREKGSFISKYDDSVETFAKLTLMQEKEKNGVITADTISNIQRSSNLGNSTLNYILSRMEISPDNVDYRARYMIAGLLYPTFMEAYNKNKSETLSNIKEYFKCVKNNDFEGCLKCLSIKFTSECLEELINKTNKRVANIESGNIPLPKRKSSVISDAIEASCEVTKFDQIKNQNEVLTHGLDLNKDIKKY